jgi:RNA polymerase sigma-70 factor (ECF subfamily)
MSEKLKEQKFKKLLSENKDMIYRLCYAYLYNKNDVEDLFQEIMISIWNSLESFRNEAKISTWIYRIAVNTALMHNKKDSKLKGTFKNIGVEYHSTIEDDSDEYKEKDEQIKKLREAIVQLNKQDRLIISLVLEGVKYEEISEIMGMTMSNVGVKINRVKTKLFKLMQENGNG